MRANSAQATGRSPNRAARNESPVISNSCASLSNSANSRIIASRMGTSVSVAGLIVKWFFTIFCMQNRQLLGIKKQNTPAPNLPKVAKPFLLLRRL